MVATDLSERSDRALRRAAQLAKFLGAKLSIISVVDSAYPEHLVKDIKARFRDHLEQISRFEGIETETHIDTGDVVETLLGYLNAKDVDLAVVGLHRARTIFDGIRPTTMERLVEGTRKPQLLVKEMHTENYKRVMVPVSFSRACKSAIDASAEVAPGAKFDIFHAWLVPFGGLTGGEHSDYADSVRTEIQEISDAWSAGLDDSMPQPQIVHGALTPTFEYHLRSFNPDLVALGAHTRPGPSLHKIGSFAAELIRDPPVDLLISRGARA